MHMQGASALNAIAITARGPALVVPVENIQVQPGSFTFIPVALDTAPTRPVNITAVSSDRSVATVEGSLMAGDTGMCAFVYVMCACTL